jgi:hypothetical protein
MAQNVRPVDDQRSLGELFGDLSREISTLFRQEVELARAEISSKLPKLGWDIGFLVIGGVVAHTGVLALVATAIIVLAYALPWWLAALIVGVVVTAGGLLLVQRGIAALRSESLAPQQTVATLKEDAQWVKEQMS